MKLLKHLAVGALIVASPTVVSAQTILHIAGSTAYRTAVSSAICNYLNSTTGTNKQVHVAYATGATPAKNNYAVYADGAVQYSSGTYVTTAFTNTSGTSIPAATTIIETNWTGSASGVLDVVVQNKNVGFLNLQDTTTPNANNVNYVLNNSVVAVGVGGITDTGTGNVSGSIGTGSPSFIKTNAPEVAMSDSFATSVASALSTATVTAQPGSISISPLSGAGLASAVNTSAAGSLVEAGGGAGTRVISSGSSAGYLGIVPFCWTLGSISGETLIPFTNITTRTVQFIENNGSAPFTLFSALAADNATANDATKFVYLVGRNEDSGTRIDAFAEGQEGFTKNPKQLILSFATYVASTAYPPPTDYNAAPYGIGGATNSVTSQGLWPASATLNTETNITWNTAGHSGYAGGGDLVTVLSTPVNQSMDAANGSNFASQNAGNSYYIGYVSVADAGGFVTPASSTYGATGTSPGKGLTTLAFNGVPFSFGNVTDGAYSFWSYEHMYYLKSGTGAISTTIPASGTIAPKTIADALADSISTTYADYDSTGVAQPVNGKGAGIPLPASATGEVSLSVEGGSYTLATY